MAITNAQQYQQLFAKGGRIGLKGGADASTASFGESVGYSGPSRDDPKGGFDLSGGQGPTFDGAPASQLSQDVIQAAAEEAARQKALEDIRKQTIIGTNKLTPNYFDRAVNKAKTLNTNIRNKLISGFIDRTVYDNLYNAGIYGEDETDLLGMGIPSLTGIATRALRTMNPPADVKAMDVDSIRELGLTGQIPSDMSKSQLSAMQDVRRNLENKAELESQGMTQSRFEELYPSTVMTNKDRGDGGQTYIPPVLTPYQEDVVEEVDPNSLQGLLANRVAYRFMADGGRAGFMGGGMPDDFIGGLADGNLDEMGRQMYGLGKLVKKATRAVKKIVKSPVGKAALAFGVYKLGGSLLKNDAVKEFLFAGKAPAFSNLTGKGVLAGIGGISALSGLMSKPEEDDEEETYYRGPGLDIDAIRRNPYGSKGSAYGFYAEGGDVKEPVAKDTMPLLDMDGMEKDYRADGGFVPIGRMERADDVPARLSKNEFVFTADAVRNAGDGDVDKGAEVMYNMMKNLESGGKVSEESQGLDGARDMFQTSKRLEEVL